MNPTAEPPLTADGVAIPSSRDAGSSIRAGIGPDGLCGDLGDRCAHRETPRAPSTMTSDPPLISVCMPVYNAGRYLAQAVESILDQTLGDFEFLILDDGSTDGSLEILRRYAARDPRIRLTSRPNKGVAATLNELVDQARGEFIARMDADDIARPERFATQVEYLRAHPECVLAGSWVRLIDPEGDPLCDWRTLQEQEAIEAHALRAVPFVAISHPSVMMRRDAVLAAGKYRPLANEDVDLFLRIGEQGRVVNLPAVLLYYRVHTSNISKAAAYREKADRELVQIAREARQRRNLPEPDDPPGGPEALGAPPADDTPLDERAKWAWWALGAGHVGSARKHARWVFSRAPLSPRSWKLIYCTLRGY